MVIRPYKIMKITFATLILLYDMIYKKCAGVITTPAHFVCHSIKYSALFHLHNPQYRRTTTGVIRQMQEVNTRRQFTEIDRRNVLIQL